MGRWWWRKHRPRIARSQGVEEGASWYDAHEGTACGFHAEDSGGLGVAHKYLPCGTRVTLCSARCATVTVDDRGPFVAGREWDLSEATRDAIGYPGDPAGVIVK